MTSNPQFGIFIQKDAFEGFTSSSFGGVIAIWHANHIQITEVAFRNCSCSSRGGNAFLKDFSSATARFLCAKSFRSGDRGQSLSFEQPRGDPDLSDSSFCQTPKTSGVNSGIRYSDCSPVMKRDNFSYFTMNPSYVLGNPSLIGNSVWMSTFAHSKANSFVGDSQKDDFYCKCNFVSNEGSSTMFVGDSGCKLEVKESIFIENSFRTFCNCASGGLKIWDSVAFECGFVEKSFESRENRPFTHRIKHIEDYECNIIPTVFSVSDVFSMGSKKSVIPFAALLIV